MANPKPGLTFYRRGLDATVFVRDLHGGLFSVWWNGARYVARAEARPAPWYNRFDWANEGRFTRGLATPLATLFANAPAGLILDSPPLISPPAALPQSRRTSRRTSQQGMGPSMAALYPPGGAVPTPTSAKSYAGTLGFNGEFEWCHLIAHSMGGQDGPNNVVAGRDFNNSEQLIIENLLSAYRAENNFWMRVSALRLGANADWYMGRAIRYTIGDGASSLSVYLDCQATNRPTAVHLHAVTSRIARWLNDSLRMRTVVHITTAELQQILADCPVFSDVDPGRPAKRRGPDDDLGEPEATLPKRKRARPARR